MVNESKRIKEAQTKLMFLKTQENIKHIVFINAVLEKYANVLRIINK